MTTRSEAISTNGELRTLSPARRCLTGGRLNWLIVAVIISLVPSAGAAALSVSTIDARSGLLWLGSYGGGQAVAPSPLESYWGAAPAINFNSSFSLVPEIDLMGTWYQQLGTRAIPTEMEYINPVWLLSILVDPAFRYTLHITKDLAWGMSLSPAFVFKVPIVQRYATSQQVSSIVSYFYAKGHYVYPSAGTFFQWQVFPKTALEVRIRALFPLFHAWDGEGLPFYDQLMVDGSIALRLSLGK